MTCKVYIGPGPVSADWDGAIFHFRDTTPAEALREAFELADGQDVRLGGDVSTVREFLDVDLVDDFHKVMVPIVLGRGQRLWDGPQGWKRGSTSAWSRVTTASRTCWARGAAVRRGH